MKAGSVKKPCPIWLLTCLVTSRYMRLKHASPSAPGSAASIASIRAITSAIVVTGASGTGGPADMTITIGSPARSGGLLVELFDAPDAGDRAVDRHAVPGEQGEYLLAAVGEEADRAGLAAQPEPDRDPAGGQGGEFGDRQLVVPGFPGRDDPAADHRAV